MISTTHNLEMIPTHNLEFPLMFQKLFPHHHFRPSPFVILVLLFDTAQKNVAAALQFGCIATLDKPVKLELPGTPYFLADTLPLAITMAVHHAHQVRVFLFRPNLPTNATATTYAGIGDRQGLEWIWSMPSDLILSLRAGKRQYRVRMIQSLDAEQTRRATVAPSTPRPGGPFGRAHFLSRLGA